MKALQEKGDVAEQGNKSCICVNAVCLPSLERYIFARNDGNTEFRNNITFVDGAQKIIHL